MAAAGSLYSIIFIFLCILAILWFFLPFAIFGTKPKLNEINDNLKETNRLLKGLLDASQPRQHATPPPAPPPPPRPEPLPPSWLPPPPRTEQGTRREPPDLPSFRPQWQDDRLR